jgi:putative ABC transport system permease protein
MLVRVKAGFEQQVAQSLQKTWKKIYPDKPLNMDWVEDLLNSQYANEAKLQQLFSFFSLLTIILAALGVFGLIVHAAGQRVKEIGVRKVLGASVTSIVRLLSADFVRLVLLAILIASPFSWWLMNKWLEDYPYRIHITWWTFALAGGIALLIALITIGFQAVRSASANPVKSLRSE